MLPHTENCELEANHAMMLTKLLATFSSVDPEATSSKPIQASTSRHMACHLLMGSFFKAVFLTPLESCGLLLTSSGRPQNFSMLGGCGSLAGALLTACFGQGLGLEGLGLGAVNQSLHRSLSHQIPAEDRTEGPQ